MTIIINNIVWNISFEPADSPKLKKHLGEFSVGACDLQNHCIYINENARGDFLKKILLHEITHAFIYSYDLSFDYLKEEYIADFVASYGEAILDIYKKIEGTV